MRMAAVLALLAPFADALGQNGVFIGVLSVISMVLGYLLLWALYYYVFSSKADARRAERLQRRRERQQRT